MKFRHKVMENTEIKTTSTTHTHTTNEHITEMLCAYFIVYCSVHLFAVDDSTVIGYFSLLLFLVWFDSLSLFNLVCVLVVFFSFCLMLTTDRHIH